MKVRTLPIWTLSIWVLAIAGCSDDDTPDTNNPLIDSTSIDRVVNEFIASNDVVGLSVATVNKSADKTLIWSNQYGFKNRESQTPVDAETSFWMGSVSKAVMATALMIANEKGFLGLDDDIHAVLDNQGTFSLNNPNQAPVTLAHLATHTSGILDEPEDDDEANLYNCAYFVPNDDGGHEMLLDILDIPNPCPAQSPVSLPGFLGAFLDANGELYRAEKNFSDAAPGNDEEYSNIGAGLAGHMIELTTGQDLATFAKQEIFSPLAMTNTSWKREDFQLEDIAVPYLLFDEGLTAIPVYELATWPDGGLRSNAADIAELLAVVMNNGLHQATGTTLLSDTSISRMLPAEGEEYGVFWTFDEDLYVEGELRLVTGHSGSDPGAFSMMVFDPVSELGVVVIGNGDDENIDNDDGSPLEKLFEALFVGAAAMQ